MCKCDSEDKKEATTTGGVAGYTTPLTNDGEAEDAVERELSFEEVINNFKEAINKMNHGS